MGLRIHSNLPALTALRNLRLTMAQEARSLERLATGLRINYAADDPSGYVISTLLRSQIVGLTQASENSQNASNILGIAESGLQGISEQLREIRASVVAALGGGLTPEQLAAEQASIDAAIQAITLLARTTRFGGRGLLNGQAALTTLGSVGAFLNDLRIQAVSFPQGVTSHDFSGTLVASAIRAWVRVGETGATGSTIRVTGALGTQDITLPPNATSAMVRAAINQVAPYTGVYASNINVAAAPAGAGTYAMSMEFGAAQSISIEVISGSFGMSITGAPVPLGPGSRLEDIGDDPVIMFDGIRYQGSGRDFRVLSPRGQFQFALAIPTTGTALQQNLIIEPASIPAGQLNFRVGRSGLTFQLRERPYATDALTIGIPPVSADMLGFESIPDVIARAAAGADSTLMQGGYLTSLQSGGANNIVSGNRANALRIVDAAITQVAQQTAHIGSVQANTLTPNRNAIDAAVEELTDFEARIREIDVAEETANLARIRVLREAAAMALASANLLPQSVFRLLTGEGFGGD